MTERTVVIVSGSRDWIDRVAIEARLRNYQPGTIVLHGAADGADTIAAQIAIVLGFVPVGHPYFGEEGRRGGPIRNSLLVELGKVYQRYGYQVFVEAFVLPDSVGTVDLIAKAKKAGFQVNEWPPP